MTLGFHRATRLAAIYVLLLSPVFGQAPQFVTLADVQPLLSATQSPDLKTVQPLTAAEWDKWVRTRDKDIRSRLEAGEENTLTNLLRLGVTYTNQPRITYEGGELDRYGSDNFIDRVANRRADGLIRALAGPHPSEGMLEMRQFLEKKGYTLKTAEGRARVKTYLLDNLARLRDDVRRAHQEAKANRYHAFKHRGISTDSNLFPDFMIELQLRNMLEEGLLNPASVHRIGIIGPGLDFVNKKSGSDFYPPQTAQPFAVIDSLVRLGLADPNSIELYTLDISPRVNSSIERARKNAVAGKPYTIQLLVAPSDQWDGKYHANFLDYWHRLGSRVGKEVKPIPVPQEASDIWNRAVSVNPDIVKRVAPVDMNIVFERMALPPDKQFDLMFATNIFVYYDSFEQALARANIGTMIKPGGFLITNEALPNTAPSTLKDSLQTTAIIESSPVVKDYAYSYQRQP